MPNWLRNRSAVHALLSKEDELAKERTKGSTKKDSSWRWSGSDSTVPTVKADPAVDEGGKNLVLLFRGHEVKSCGSEFCGVCGKDALRKWGGYPDVTPVRAPSFLPSSDPIIRARKITDIRFHQIAAYFPLAEDGEILAVHINKDVEEGFIELVYKVKIEDG